MDIKMQIKKNNNIFGESFNEIELLKEENVRWLRKFLFMENNFHVGNLLDPNKAEDEINKRYNILSNDEKSTLGRELTKCMEGVIMHKSARLTDKMILVIHHSSDIPFYKDAIKLLVGLPENPKKVNWCTATDNSLIEMVKDILCDVCYAFIELSDFEIEDKVFHSDMIATIGLLYGQLQNKFCIIIGDKSIHNEIREYADKLGILCVRNDEFADSSNTISQHIRGGKNQ